VILQHILLAIVLVLFTVFVHASVTVGLLTWLHSPGGRRWATGSQLARISLLGAVVSGMTVISFVEASAWAFVYVWLGALPSMPEAVYFSLVTFTTLGYGDVTLGETWRLLGALQSANGVIIFGWTTAVVVALLQRMLAFAGDQRSEA
jgi:hypothetical protein